VPHWRPRICLGLSDGRITCAGLIFLLHPFSSFVRMIMTDYRFLPGEVTPMQINRVGEVIVEPLERVYNFAPVH
jgi:hypothetical protein